MATAGFISSAIVHAEIVRISKAWAQDFGYGIRDTSIWGFLRMRAPRDPSNNAPTALACIRIHHFRLGLGFQGFGFCELNVCLKGFVFGHAGLERVGPCRIYRRVRLFRILVSNHRAMLAKVRVCWFIFAKSRHVRFIRDFDVLDPVGRLRLGCFA